MSEHATTVMRYLDSRPARVAAVAQIARDTALPDTEVWRAVSALQASHAITVRRRPGRGRAARATMCGVRT